MKYKIPYKINMTARKLVCNKNYSSEAVEIDETSTYSFNIKLKTSLYNSNYKTIQTTLFQIKHRTTLFILLLFYFDHVIVSINFLNIFFFQRESIQELIDTSTLIK
jgi:hypothetical protein